MTAHFINRKKMFWKASEEDAKFSSLKNIDNNKLVIIRNVVKTYSTETNNIWFNFTKDEWITAINQELYLRNKKANIVIKNCLNYLPIKTPKNNLISLSKCENRSNIPMNKILKSLMI